MSRTLHHIAMKLSRRLIIRRKLPVDFGRVSLLVSSDGGLKYLLKKTKDIDPMLLQFSAEFVKPGAVVWDIGANLGYFSFSAAAKAGPTGQIFAFEPDTWLVSLLRKSASLQPETSAKVSIIPAAIADDVDIQTFIISDFARATNHLASYGSSFAGTVRSEQIVVTLSLDWLGKRLAAPQILKIDVEGAELEVLQGGLDLISEHRPIILCEVASKNSNAIFKLMKQFDYQIYDAEVPPAQRTSLSEPVANTLALPS